MEQGLLGEGKGREGGSRPTSRMVALRGETRTLNLVVWTVRREERRWKDESTSERGMKKEKSLLSPIANYICIVIYIRRFTAP